MILSSSFMTADKKNEYQEDTSWELHPYQAPYPSYPISEYLKNGIYAKEYPTKYETTRHVFNKYINYYKYFFVMYHKKVVGYEIRKKGLHYNKRIINCIPMDHFPEPYVYIAEVLTKKKFEYHITTSYDDAYNFICHFAGAGKMIYQVPLDHIGGPEYYFGNWAGCSPDGYDPDKEYFYNIYDQLPKDLEAQKRYMVRLYSYIQYRIDPNTNQLIRKEVFDFFEPWDWDHFTPEFFYTWDRSVLPE